MTADHVLLKGYVSVFSIYIFPYLPVKEFRDMLPAIVLNVFHYTVSSHTISKVITVNLFMLNCII